MNLYFAPLEGITNYIYRNIHNKFFGGCDFYFAPFITPSDNERISLKSFKDISCENNRDINLKIQVLLNNSETFFKFVRKAKQYNYDEININIGCPSLTVVKKQRGAGLLRDLDCLDNMLYNIFDKTNLKVSIKTRTGYYSQDEFKDILNIYNKYPIKELIVHPRTKEDVYKGKASVEAFSYAYNNSNNPLCYNGDIYTVEDFYRIKDKFPHIKSIMIGRGAIINPGIFREIKTGKKITTKELINFSNALKDEYLKILNSETFTLQKMKEIWLYMILNYPDNKKIAKEIKKAKKPEELISKINYLPKI